jgi:hypothetical protein
MTAKILMVNIELRNYGKGGAARNSIANELNTKIAHQVSLPQYIYYCNVTLDSERRFRASKQRKQTAPRHNENTPP